jgi:hypothetical protein
MEGCTLWGSVGSITVKFSVYSSLNNNKAELSLGAYQEQSVGGCQRLVPPACWLVATHNERVSSRARVGSAEMAKRVAAGVDTLRPL